MPGTNGGAPLLGFSKLLSYLAGLYLLTSPSSASFFSSRNLVYGNVPAGELLSGIVTLVLGLSNSHVLFAAFVVFGITAPILKPSMISAVVALTVALLLVLFCRPVKFSFVPFLEMVSETVAASSSGRVMLVVDLRVMLAETVSAVPTLPVQLLVVSVPFAP